MNEQKQYTFKIVTTGPESSGKTELAKSLAAFYKTNWVPEFARHYLTHIGRSYHKEDLPAIGRGQQAWECWYAKQTSRFLICDTDWTVLEIWENYRFGSADHWHLGYQYPEAADLYLLCTPDFPWQPDPLREHPAERDPLFREYKKLLQLNRLPHLEVQGPQLQRLQDAILEIDKLFGPL